MPQQSRTFRIFVSSTFSDLKAERNALQAQVFPKLRELCQRHGCRLQVIQQGTPCLLQVGGCRLCLRTHECRQVLVRPIAAAG